MKGAVVRIDGNGRLIVLNLLSFLDAAERVVPMADVSKNFHQEVVAFLQYRVVGGGDTQDTNIRLVYHALLQWVSYANLRQS